MGKMTPSVMLGTIALSYSCAPPYFCDKHICKATIHYGLRLPHMVYLEQEVQRGAYIRLFFLRIHPL